MLIYVFLLMFIRNFPAKNEIFRMFSMWDYFSCKCLLSFRDDVVWSVKWFLKLNESV